ncbi:MAG: glycosyltransferase family 9 protein [Calditrichaeota bacterium]|nr:glycosyltransferase family 9 protein [Calditrichota bacterium]MCB9366285.1 glycosyltransferase family 9 protein [Calditrichota bacterium]
MHDAKMRILVFRNGSIGNTIAAIPALRCLRESFESAEIMVVVDSLGEELLRNCPYVNRIIVYEKRGKDSGILGFLRVARTLRSLYPTHALLLKRFRRNGALARISGASVRAGFETDGRAEFLNVTIPYDDGIHVCELNLRLVQAIGGKCRRGLLPELFLVNEDRAAASAALVSIGVREDYVVAHFGGITTGASHVAMALRLKLIERFYPDCPVVLIGSGAKERDDANRLHALLPRCAPLLDVPLRTVMAIMEQAKGFIGTNSGPMHIAAAAEVPGVALFRSDETFAAESVKWRPLFSKLRILPVPPDTDDSSIDALVEEAARLFSGGESRDSV